MGAALDPDLFLPEPATRDVWATVISVDDHVVEPPHTFEGRLPVGLADRALTIELFASAMGGKTAEALEAFAGLYALGADPVVVTLDLLDHAHGASVAKALGPDALGLPSDQAARPAAAKAARSWPSTFPTER